MHHEFQPAGAPDPDDPDVALSIPPEQITTELLELCEQFFRQSSPIVHTELCEFLTGHGHHGGLGWFLDALGFATLARPGQSPQVTRHVEGRAAVGRPLRDRGDRAEFINMIDAQGD